MAPTKEAEDRASYTHYLIVVTVVPCLLSISFLAVALRLWCRRTIRQTGMDDFAAVLTLLCVMGFGSGILALIPLGLNSPSGTLPSEHAVAFYKCSYISVFFYGQGLFWARMSFLLLYYRIVSLSGWRKLYLGAIILTIMWNIALILIYFLQCIPLEAMWNPTIRATKCLPHQLALAYSYAAISIAFDLAVAILPLPVIWNLNLRWSQKVLLSGGFVLGCFSIALAIMRIIWIENWSHLTWEIVRPNLWALAEVSSGLVCACIPTYKPLLIKITAVLPHHDHESDGSILGQRESNEAEIIPASVESKGSFSGGYQGPENDRMYGTQTYITAGQDTWRV